MSSMLIDNEHPTLTLTRTDPMTSVIRQRSLLYQIQCRAQIDTLF